MTPAALVVTGELPSRSAPAEKETDPVGFAPDAGSHRGRECDTLSEDRARRDANS